MSMQTSDLLRDKAPGTLIGADTTAGALRGVAALPGGWMSTVTSACPVDQDVLATSLLDVLNRSARHARDWSSLLLDTRVDAT